MIETIQLEHGSQEWLDFRKTGGIGGSEASAILGFNPYMDNIALWNIKTGKAQKELITNNAAIEYGQKAEQYLRELFKLDFPQYEVTEPKSVVYRKDCMFASLDGNLKELATGRKGVLEIKTSEIFASMTREKWDDKIPQNYYIQVLHYMATIDADFAILLAQLKSTAPNGTLRKTTKHYFIERSEVQSDIDFLVKEEKKFWNDYVLKNIMPPRQLGNL